MENPSSTHSCKSKTRRKEKQKAEERKIAELRNFRNMQNFAGCKISQHYEFAIFCATVHAVLTFLTFLLQFLCLPELSLFVIVINSGSFVILLS